MDLQFVKGDSLFAKINKVIKQYNYLTEDVETDVIIVGGGVTGSILGYYFSKNNINSVILEKNIIGYGSTGITTALLQYELDGTVRELEQYTTNENVIQSYKLGIKALNEIEEFIKQYDNNCNYKKRDTLFYTAKSSDIAQIKEEYKIRKENGFDVEFIEEKNNPFSFDLKAGLYSKNGGAEIDPYKFTHQLIDVSTKKGLRVYENTEAVKVLYNDDGVEVVTKYDFKVRGKIVIVATGYHTDLFTSRNFGVTTTAFNIVTKPLDNFNGYYNKVLIRDNKEPYNYLRTTADNRIIIGGEDINFIPDIYNKKQVSEKYSILEQRLKSMFPNIKNIDIEYKYCGAFTSTQDNLGFIGKDPKNKKLWFNLGYGANGILFAILGGIMLNKLYLGEIDENLKLFRVDRFDN
ncbi:FAD-binding oxidoreductase [Clostridium botulinum]|nr:oxidoreductase [Clostridium botulinum]MBY6779650.1 FAD-binding oxidoreductase [Clostridium botulinum]MBY6852846.1 FAD-binding oxidoreductase [Clostridium botulinum]NFF22446.1 FAD-binding oxidoreductase [Clostridium botulinum]NFF35265.1 FAD-binding oxidoreductase [Clostridium botulinum]